MNSFKHFENQFTQFLFIQRHYFVIFITFISKLCPKIAQTYWNFYKLFELVMYKRDKNFKTF